MDVVGLGGLNFKCPNALLIRVVQVELAAVRVLLHDPDQGCKQFSAALCFATTENP